MQSIANKKNELNIMVEDINLHIIGITESWANKDISDAELGLTEHVIIGAGGGAFSILIQVACGLMMVKYWCHIFDAIK